MLALLEPWSANGRGRGLEAYPLALGQVVNEYQKPIESYGVVDVVLGDEELKLRRLYHVVSR